MTDSFDRMITPKDGENVDALRAAWKSLGELEAPAPPESMGRNFVQALAAYESAITHSLGETSRRSRRRVPIWVPALAASVALVVGAAGGVWIAISGGGVSRLAALEARVEDLQRTQALTLLGHISTPRRLEGVRLAASLAGDPMVRARLLDRVTFDQNTNVRLAALEAIQPFSNSDDVQRELLTVLPAEPSPLVQAALLDVLIERGVRELVPVLEEFFVRDTVLPELREIAERGMRVLR